jgi:hypothetical protein
MAVIRTGLSTVLTDLKGARFLPFLRAPVSTAAVSRAPIIVAAETGRMSARASGRCAAYDAVPIG